MSGSDRQDRAREWRPLPLASLGLHAVVPAALLVDPGTWPWGLGALVADHTALVLGGLLPRAAWLGPNLRRLAPGSVSDDAVALTFDDGPDPDVTPAVLDALSRHGARASFFCVGEKVERHPALATRIVAEGHRIENHTHTHPHGFAFSGPWRTARQLDRAQEAIEKTTGRRPVWFRAPAGIRNPWLEPVLRSRGLHLTSWTRRGYDTVSRDADRILARLTSRLRPGDIVLLHDGSSRTGPDGRPVVLAVLGRLLGTLRERSLRAVSLPDPAAPDAGSA